MYSYGPPHMAEQKQDDQLEHTYSSSARIRYVALKTCQRRWTIGRSGERGSGISVLPARHESLWLFEEIYNRVSNGFRLYTREFLYSSSSWHDCVKDDCLHFWPFLSFRSTLNILINSTVNLAVCPTRYTRGILPVVVVNEIDCAIVAIKFELQSCYYVHFRTNTFREGMNLLIPCSYDLNSSNFILQKRLLWH